MLNWLRQFNIFCLLDNQQYDFSRPAFDFLLAAGSEHQITMASGNALQSLDEFIGPRKDWLFGHLGYDLKNEIEVLSSGNKDGLAFPDMHFFVPSIIIRCVENVLKIGTLEDNAAIIFDEINNCHEVATSPGETVHVKQRFSQTEYIDTVDEIRKHIHRGDCYELNFCQEFYSDDAQVDPFELYQKLTSLSPNPFSAFYKLDDKYLLCASPERYCKRVGDTLISQPIKGTIKRNTVDKVVDDALKKQLQSSEKERAENVMVVDLVRNDLSRICIKGSVKVDELYGIYSFPQVHQMISTVSGKLAKETSFGEIIRATFPMGSMTGAPKKKVMELIEKYERTKRGLFSGALGYIDPQGDFDFNVVIRSIQYNDSLKYLSFQAGSAITFSSNAVMEYEECLWKAEAMIKVLE